MSKIYKKDGSFYYYYYKKKRGKKKKRGPKSNKNKIIKKNYKSWDFKIIRCDFKKQIEYIGKYHDLIDVEKKKNELLQQNSTVEIPIKFINNKRVSKKHYQIESEYVILKRIKEGQNNENKLRNEYGKIITFKTTSEKWFIYDKIPCLIEEAFWVYGFHPKTQRKTINWIYNEFIDDVINQSYEIVQIYLYNNKVVFRYSENHIEFVITKNVSDAIRVYNFLNKRYEKNKQVIFTGLVKGHSDRAKEIISLISEKTGWDNSKIYRKST